MSKDDFVSLFCLNMWKQQECHLLKVVMKMKGDNFYGIDLE